MPTSCSSSCQLTEKRKSKVEDLSGGMKRRLTIARSLVNKPDLLLLDEPTTGLDPQARHVLWDQLFRLKQAGVTLVITTHYMDEAEQLCDRLVVMDKGLIVAEGSPRELIEEHSTREVAELRFGVGEARADRREDRRPRRPLEVLPDRLLVYSDDGEEVIAKVHERGLAAGRRAGTPLHPRGRLPEPHRPDVGGLMATPPVRLARGHDCGRPTTGGRSTSAPGRRGRHLLRHRRCSTWWRWACCSAASSSGDPTLEGATSYLAFIVPGLVAAHAMQIGGGGDDLPGDGRDQVAQDLLRA